ncbi:MAG: hypothetical protein U0905_16770 [Pirellulales bacterium]
MYRFSIGKRLSITVFIAILSGVAAARTDLAALIALFATVLRLLYIQLHRSGPNDYP